MRQSERETLEKKKKQYHGHIPRLGGQTPCIGTNPRPFDCLVGLGLFHRVQLGGLRAQTVPIPEEQYMLARPLGLGAGLDPLAHARALVHGLDEANRSIDGIGAVVAAHDGLDGLGGLVGVVEGDSADVVVQDVRLDDTVQQVAADETEFTINGCGSALDKGPLLASVVGQSRVGVLEEGDGDCQVEKIVSR